jgi:hypothetical protein
MSGDRPANFMVFSGRFDHSPMSVRAGKPAPGTECAAIDWMIRITFHVHDGNGVLGFIAPV